MMSAHQAAKCRFCRTFCRCQCDQTMQGKHCHRPFFVSPPWWQEHRGTSAVILAIFLLCCANSATGRSTQTTDALTAPAMSTTEETTTSLAPSVPLTTTAAAATTTKTTKTTTTTTTTKPTRISTIATNTTAAKPQTTMSPAGEPVDGEGVCRTRYLTSGGSAQGSGMDEVGVAAILQLRVSRGRVCGVVSSVDLQVAAAIIWAVKLLNGQIQNPGVGTYIPGVRLDLRIYDDCGQGLTASHHVGEVLSAHADYNCTPSNPPIAGVLGTSLSQTTTRVANLLADTNVPNFGVSATLSSLSDSAMYPTFFRTVPSDLTQSKVLVGLVQKLGWNYVAGIYTRDNYGVQGFKEFRRLATMAGICVYKEEKFAMSDPSLEDDLEEFVRDMLIHLMDTRHDNLGVVLFAQADLVYAMFNMIETRRSKWINQNKLENLHWLSSDGVGTTAEIAQKVQVYQRSKVLSISIATVQLPDFRDFFLDLLDRPQQLGPYWQSLVREYLTQELNCRQDPPSTACKLRDRILLYDYVPAALDSVYSLAALLKRAHALSCTSAGSGLASGVCQNLAEAVEAGLLSLVQPEPLNYSSVFEDERLPERFRNGRLLVLDQYGDFVSANSPLYFINMASGGKWTKVGEYRNGSLSIQPESALVNVPQSECGGECRVCLIKERFNYVYYPGDHIILGLYSLREPEAEDSFECSMLYRNQGSTVAAFLAFMSTLDALKLVNGFGSSSAYPSAGTYPSVGALLLDDCYNRLTVSSLLVDLFSGMSNLTDSAGKGIDMKKVVAVVGSQSSSVTLSALSVLTPLGKPTVSYSATSADLDDRVNFPYFLRPVPSDTHQARALLDLLHAINVTHVGGLYQFNNYGLRGMQTFVSMAEEEGVCVEAPFPIDDHTKGFVILSRLNAIRSSKARVVVVFLTEPSALRVLDVAKGENLGLVFLASEAWGTGGKTLEHNRPLASRGSLVLTVNSTRQAGDVNVDVADYLRRLTRPSVTLDPEWLRDFWEKEFECNLPGGFDNAYSKMCEADGRLPEDVVLQLAGDSKVVQTVNSVLSVVLALRGLCGTNSDCPAVKNAANFTNAIKTVRLKDSSSYGQLFRPYLDSGNGNVGFTVHNLQKYLSGYRYVQVGRYDPSSGLYITRDQITFYDAVGQPIPNIDSACDPLARQCSQVCGAFSHTTPSTPVASSAKVDGGGSDGGLVAAVVVLVLLCLLLLAVGAVVVVCARRRGLPLKTFFKADDKNVNRAHSDSSAVSTSPDGPCDPTTYTQTPFRAGMPLPPVPRASICSTHQYIDLSGSAGSTSHSSQSNQQSAPVSPQAAFCEGVVSFDGEAGSYSDSESMHRPGTRAQGGHSGSKQQQREDLLRQLQENKRMEELWRHSDHHPMSHAQLMVSQDRPRASSVSHAERPKFLTLHGNRRQGGSETTSAVGSPDLQVGHRPRSLSQDALSGIRVGDVSELDQQLLLRYLASQQAQRQNANRSAQASAGDVRGSPTPSRGHGSRRKSNAASRQGTPTIPGDGISPGLHNASALGSPGEVQTPRILVQQTFPNPVFQPSAASPMTSSPVFLSSMAGSPMHKYGSLMYLHPVAADADHNLYLQSHAASSSAESPPASTAFPPGTFVVVPASMFQPAPTGVPQADPGDPGYPSTPTRGARQHSKANSVSSPVVSTPSSAASNFSGAVFLSHAQFSPHADQQAAGHDTCAESHVQKDTASYSPAENQTEGQPGNDATHAARTPQGCIWPGQVRTLSPLALRKLMSKHEKAKTLPGQGHVTVASPGPSSPGAGVQGAGVRFFHPNVLSLHQDSDGPHSDSEVVGREGRLMNYPAHTTMYDRFMSDSVFPADPMMGQGVSPPRQTVFNDLLRDRPDPHSQLLATDASQKPKTRHKHEVRHGIHPRQPQAPNPPGELTRLPPSDQAPHQTGFLPPSATPSGSREATRVVAARRPAATQPLNANLPRADSIPYIQVYQLVPVPPQCGPTTRHYSDLGSGDSSSSSGNSNHTSGDSGNVEDIQTDSNTSDVNMLAVGV